MSIIKKQVLILMAVSLVGFVAGIKLLCNPDAEIVCRGGYGDWAMAVYLGFAIIFVVLIPILFLKEGVYLSWRIFSLFFLPIVALFIVTAPDYSGGWMPILSFDKETATFFFATLYFIISLGIIIIKSWKLRKVVKAN